jgi:hypothetical protein
MKQVGLVLLFLIAVGVFAPPPTWGEGDYGNAGYYSPDELRRFKHYRRLQRERLDRLRWRGGADDDASYVHPRRRHHHHHHNQYQDQNNYRSIQCVTDFWGQCVYVAQSRYAYRWRYYRARHHHYYRSYRRGYRDDDRGYRRGYREDREDGYYGRSRERIDPGLQCHARRRVVGEEKSSRAKAERAADNAWMGSVRFDHGERYQDLNHAKDVRHNCGPSSTTSILKRVFFRCVIEATPCRAPLGETTRVERKYEDDKGGDDD